MYAWVETSDHKYELKEMGEPVCGEDFCDGCGDCIYCYGSECGCEGTSWVIDLNDERNPYRND